jgi:glycosyltransferase involved in cell wall biosynthesis
MGAAAARNTGVAAADSELVAFLDSDDVWLPDKLAQQVAFMHEHGFSASCTAVHLVRAGLRGVVWPRYASGALSRADLIWGCSVSPGSTLVCKRSVFGEIGMFEPTMRRLEDWDWLLRYAQHYPLGFLARPLARIEPSSNPDFGSVMTAIDVMQSRHMPAMDGATRRRFAAALDFERAGAHYRCGDFLSSAVMVLKSLVRTPLRNGAVAAALHNRLARG